MESMLYIFDVNKTMLPEAVQTPINVAIRLIAWVGAAAIISFLSRWWLSHHTDWNALTRTLVALAPLVPSLLWARSIARWVRQLDELQRRIQYEAWLFAATGTTFVLTGLDLVESAGIPRWERLQHGLGWEGGFALLFLLYGVGCLTSNRRFQ